MGTIQGTVIDKATGEALSDVAVSLNFQPEEADEPSVITDTTGSEGTFAFTGVPVNSEADYTSMDEGLYNVGNSPYTLKISAESYDNYRDLYRMNAPLGFSATGGDGAAMNLVSDVTIPLSEQAVTLTGKALDDDEGEGKALSDVKVELYQEFSPFASNSGIGTDMLVDSATTGSDGSFTFEGVEEDADVWLLFRDDSDPANVINYEYTNIDDTPSADGSNPEMHLGVIEVDQTDETSAFNITSVTPAPNSDISSTDTSFVYEFNRPVSENAWTDASRGFGSGTFKDKIEFSDEGMKKSPGDLEFYVSWSEDRTALTITPEGLMDATEYILDVEDAIDHPDFVDEHEKRLSYGSSDFSSGEVETLEFSIGVNNESPHTPEISHNDGFVDYNDGALDASWEVDESSADVKKYEVWIKRGDQAYEHHEDISRNEIDFDEAEYDISPDGEDPLVGVNDNLVPDEAITHSYKVRAVSSNLVEGEFSNEITFADSTQPSVVSAEYAASNEVTVTFSEPLNKSDVEDASNYTFANASVEAVEYNASYTSDVYTTEIVVDDVNNLSNGETLELDSGISDLAGNELDNNTVELVNRAPHTPQLAVDEDSYDVDWDRGSLTMNWDVDHSQAEVDHYEIWISQDGDAFNKHDNELQADDADWGEYDYTWIGDSDPDLSYPERNWDSSLLIVDRSKNPVDFSAVHRYEIKIKAVSTDGFEGQFSDPITVEDVTDPQVTNASYNGADEITVQYSEPMSKSEVENADNYSFDDGGTDPGITIESIEYADNNAPYEVTITVEDGNNVSAGQEVTVINVFDLSGNVMDTDNNSANY